MQTIYIRGGDKEEPGVDVLKHHLENIGHRVVRAKTHDYDVVVCWGVSMRDPLVRKVPALNANVNLFNKYEALMRFKRAGAPIPTTLASYELDDAFFGQFPPTVGPWFGRKFHHERGKDIEIYKTYRDVVQQGAKDFYTLYYPHTQELRYWVFNGEVFAVYHKQYRNPGVENYKNMEFRSENRDDLVDGILIPNAAVGAVKALKMDFGAVDVLDNGREGFAVLEVNSMPDISSYERVSGIRLAKLISKWAERA